MIQEVKGDLMKAKVDIIAHQTNCKGVMGAGVAKEIKEFLTKDEYRNYTEWCKKYDSKLLGHTQLIYCKRTSSKLKFIANLYGQYNYGRNKQYTDYKALKEAFKELYNYADMHDYSIAIPKYIGCGLAGGDWETVYHKIIYPIFNKSVRVTLYIYYL